MKTIFPFLLFCFAALKIDAQNVGIGTATPTFPLTVFSAPTGGPVIYASTADNADAGVSVQVTGVMGELTNLSGSPQGAAIRGHNRSTNANGLGVYGSQAGSGIGVLGNSPDGNGVKGISGSGIGVLATSSNGIALKATNSGLQPTALFTNNFQGPALQASSSSFDYSIIGSNNYNGTAAGVYGVASAAAAGSDTNGVTGVLGEVSSAAGTSGAAGVRGLNRSTGPLGAGVTGYHFGNGSGVFGRSDIGNGVLAATATGTAVRATASGNGTALNAGSMGSNTTLLANNFGTGNSILAQAYGAGTAVVALGGSGLAVEAITSSAQPAVSAINNGSGSGVYGRSGDGMGVAGYSATGTAVFASVSGNGYAINANSTGNFPTAQINNFGTGSAMIAQANGIGTGIIVSSSSGSAVDATTTSALPAVKVSNNGNGAAVDAFGNSAQPVLKATNNSTGIAVDARSSNGTAVNALSMGSSAAVSATNNFGGIGIYASANLGTGASVFSNTGTALVANTGSGANIALFQLNNANKARIDNTGKGFFNGGTQSSGADLAESFAVEGFRDHYEPGDVLAISMSSDRTVTKSAGPYSNLVVGVYATKPGVLLTEKSSDADISGEVPMGVVGVIPTKVCNENGIIHRGDLLVTSSVPGYAMKADDDKIKPGTLIGKALENFISGEKGIIKVMVNVR